MIWFPFDSHVSILERKIFKKFEKLKIFEYQLLGNWARFIWPDFHIRFISSAVLFSFRDLVLMLIENFPYHASLASSKLWTAILRASAKKSTIINQMKQITVIKCISVTSSSDPSPFIFEINVGKSRIRQTTTLTLNDEFLDWLKIDWRCRCSNSESFYVGSDSFRHWFQK